MPVSDTQVHLVNRIEMSSELLDYNSQILGLLASDPPAIPYDVTYRVLNSEVLLTELEVS